MNKTTLFPSALFMILLMAGCGGDSRKSSSGGGGDSDGPSLDDLRAAVIDRFCEDATDCHRYESVADCKAATNPGIEQIKVSVNAGRVKYHADKVDACLDTLSSNLGICSYSQLLTSPTDDAPAECTAVFEGTVADGQACYVDEECVSGHCEEPATCMMECCEGMCAKKPTPIPPAKIGESCANGEDCESGAYCQLDNMANPTTCAAQVAEGQACTGFSECKAPGSCVFDPMGGTSVCKLPAAHGAACDANSFFACDLVDDYCDPTTKVCTVRKLVGEACSDMILCVEYALCGASGKCEKKGLTGAACDPNASNDACMSNLQCVSGKCGFDPETTCP